MKRAAALLMACMLFFTTFAMAEMAEPVEAIVGLLLQEGGAAQVHGMMAEDVRTAMSVDAVSSIWPQLEALGGAYIGLLDDAKQTETQGYIVHTRTLHFKQSYFQCQVTMDEHGTIWGLWFAPVTFSFTGKEQSSDNFTEEEVTIGHEPWTLPGTLTLPADPDGPVPAVVLVHGTGVTDRDETIGSIKPFRDLAEMLAEKGIATIRYDKRTYVYGAEIAALEDYATFSVEDEFIQDALAAADALKQDARIDPERIYVLGHSMGGMLAPRIVYESDGAFCGMILACATDKSIIDVIFRQNEDAVANSNMTAEYAAEQYAMLETVRQQTAELMAMSAEEVTKYTLFNAPAFYYWELDKCPKASEYMTHLAVPTLIINGSRDFQVTPEEGKETWESVLDLSAPWLTTLWADVNHMMMAPEVDEAIAGTQLEYSVECRVEQEIINGIASFILNTEE